MRRVRCLSFQWVHAPVDRRPLSLCDTEQSRHGIWDVWPRHLPREHLDYRTTHAPHVGLKPTAGALLITNHLGSHPVWRALKTAHNTLLVRKLTGTEIRQLHVAVVGQEDIRALRSITWEAVCFCRTALGKQFTKHQSVRETKVKNAVFYRRDGSRSRDEHLLSTYVAIPRRKSHLSDDAKTLHLDVTMRDILRVKV